MRNSVLVVLALFLALPALAQSRVPANRTAALQGISAADEGRRLEAVEWLAANGRQTDTEILVQHLTDESPLVRSAAEQGLWTLWSHSGDKAVDALLRDGVEQMEAGELQQAIATFSEVIKRKPDFAEGWNKRATALFLAGEFKRSLADCDEVLRRNPFHFGALAGYGQIYFQLEQYGKSIEYWKRALRVNPNMEGVEMNIKGTEKLLDERRKRAI
jgi:tetratricopeptide (TPR) repeat protein